MAPTFTRGCCTEGESRREEAQRRGPTAHERPVARAVRRAQAGDRDALAFLYARYADNVHGYVRSIVQDHHEAEEVTRHVFAKLMQAIGGYEAREAPFLAWLIRVARNAALDHLRRQRLVPVEEVRIADRARSEVASDRARSEATSALRVTLV
jgi:RNA polymerase sigma-70 factor, ECF subfamily